MILKVISAQEIMFEGEVKQVTLPGAKGSFTVLRGHAALVSTLVPGTISYTTLDGNIRKVDVQGGVADIDNNIISVCIY